MGLILPVDSGEKMGLQITLMLTVIIYIEYLQVNIPVFDDIGRTPYLLQFFVVVICLMSIALISK